MYDDFFYEIEWQKKCHKKVFSFENKFFFFFSIKMKTKN